MIDTILGIFRVAASSISSTTKEVLLNLDAGGSQTDPEQYKESAIAQKGFGALGVIARPRAPSRNASGQEVRDDTIAVRLADGLIPFVYRDLRLNAVYSNPKEGSIALVGYGGGFHSIEDTTSNSGDQKASVHVIYAPYQFTAGVPAKAHVVTLDTTPGNETISIVHGEGMAITMKQGGKNSVVIKNKAGDAYIEVDDSGIVLNGNVQVNGAMLVGNPVTAVPVMVGVGAPGAPSTVFKASINP